MKITRSIFASIIFIVIILVVFYMHVNYFRIDVVFYAAIFDGVLAAFIAGGVLWRVPFFRPLGSFEKYQLIIIWLITGYALAISVPTVIDRSLSFYLLEKIQQRGGGIRQDAFEKIFTNEYVKEHRLVDVRLTEQLESGTIVIEDGCVLLTEEGQRVARFGRYFRRNWLPTQRLLMGQYSGDLTDPFRDTISSPGYECGPK
jgi:hypothetical protein